MSYGIDFGALQTPDFLGSALKHYDYGKKMRQDRDRQSALQMYASDPQGGVDAMMAVDPVMGLKLRDDATAQMASQRRAQISQQYATDPQGARTAAIGAGDFDLAGELGKLDEQGRAKAKENAERMAVIGLTLKKSPYEARKPAIQQLSSVLQASGFSPEQIAGFDPTDEAIDGLVASSMDLKTALERTTPNWKERKNADGSTEWVDFNSVDQPQGSDAPAGQPGSVPDDLWERLKRQESGNRHTDSSGRLVTSPKGAFGVAQLMPETADMMARKLGVDPALARSDPKVNEQLGKAYLDEQLQKYGSPVLALAAYNAGPGRVDQWLQKFGDPRSGQISEREWANRIPFDETRNYVGKIMGAAPYDVASAGPTPGPPPRGRTIPGDAPQRPEWEARDGALHNSRTGDWKDDPRAAAGVEPPPEAGLTPLGAGFYKDRVGRIYQGDKSGKMVQTVGIGDEEVKKTVGTLTGINTVLAAINEFDQATKALNPAEFGPTGKYLGDANRYAKAKAAATNLQMLLKGPEVYNLGVLAGPDLEILQGVVADPERLGTAIRKNQIRPSLTQLSTSLGTKYGGLIQAFGVLGGDPKGLPGIYKSPQGRYGSGGKPAETQAPTKPVPADAVALLKRNPQLAKDFDAWYGAGAAKRALGK